MMPIMELHYVEDSKDHVFTYGIPEIAQRGLGLETRWH